MNIEKEFAKSLLRDYFNKLINNPLFSTWKKIVEYGVKLELQNYFNSSDIYKECVKVFPVIHGIMDSIKLDDIDISSKLISMTKDINIEDLHNQWNKPENFQNKGDLIFVLFKISYLEEKLKNKYSNVTEYNLDEKGIKFIELHDHSPDKKSEYIKK